MRRNSLFALILRHQNSWQIPLIALGIGILLISIANVSHINLSDAFNINVLLGFFISQIALFLYSLRFRLVMRSTGITLKVTETLRINTLAIFYHFFAPLSIGADLTKFMKLKKNSASTRHRIGSIIFDHTVGICALIVLSLVLVVIRKPELGQLNFNGYASFLILAAAVLLLTSILFRQRIKQYMAAIFIIIKSEWLLIFVAFCFSIIMHMVLAAGIFVGSHGFGIAISYLDILFVLSISMTLQSVPISLLGIGAPEIVSTAIYTIIGLSIPAALLMVALLYIYRLITSIMGGLWQILESGRPFLAPDTINNTSD